MAGGSIAPIRFGKAARRWVGRALRLAQECGASELLPEHLFASASAPWLERLGLAGFRVELKHDEPREQVPMFGATVQSLFERACPSGEGRVEEVHLLMCLNLKELALVGAPPKLADLLSQQVMANLRHRGVMVDSLVEVLGNLEIQSILPEAHFWERPYGATILDAISAICSPAAYSILLIMMLAPGPYQIVLAGCGVSEPMLIQILSHFSEECLEVLLTSIRWKKPTLTRAGRAAIAIAWNCAGRQVLGMQNLLDGLLCADMLCQPGEGATRILNELKQSDFTYSATHQMIHCLDPEPRDPVLAPEVQRTLEVARKVSQGGPISTEHLLYGLSSAGMSELRRLWLTPERIQQNFRPCP